MILNEFEGIKKTIVKQNKELEVPCHVVNAASFNFKEFTGI